MTIESSRMQIPTAAPNPVLNVQHEIQKGVSQEEQKPNAVSSAAKQVMAGSQTAVQQPQQAANVATQISNGHIDIRI